MQRPRSLQYGRPRRSNLDILFMLEKCDWSVRPKWTGFNVNMKQAVCLQHGECGERQRPCL